MYTALRSKNVLDQIRSITTGSSSSRPRISKFEVGEIVIPKISKEKQKLIEENMKKTIDSYWESSQKYLLKIKESLNILGEDIDIDKIRKV